jgi:small subunit ribosomal protein S6
MFAVNIYNISSLTIDFVISILEIIVCRKLVAISPQRKEKEMTKYEVMFIINPTLEDEKKDATVETVKEIIAADGVVGEVDVWGMRKLAYPIQKLNDGYYVVINFEGNATLPKELDRRLRISDNVMRHIIVAKDEK